MTTAQVEFTETELLLSHDYAEPLIAGGVRCHGGFDEDGRYIPPRTRFRVPAIEAWEQQRVEQFGTPILDVPLDSWPESFPNVEQAKFLIRQGVPEPIISSLTRIGTVEGFGGMLRLVPIPDLRPLFVEDIDGTAIAHLGRGLFEAHARDEAGFEQEAGHNTMWFVARDIAFENPVTADETELMLQRMGISGGPGRRAPLVDVTRVLPEEIDPMLEFLVGRMINLLFIELAAFHTFRWAEAVLADTDLVAGEGEAARLISYVRADETPHVSYLRTALSEMRDRTWVGHRGNRYSGEEMIGLLWDQALRDSLLLRRAENLRLAMGEIEHALAGRADAADVLEEMLSLGSVRRLPDGTVVDLGGSAA
ncbi:MAG: hypothetical protein WHS89_02645 [Acidimicrobiales bacterium]